MKMDAVDASLLVLNTMSAFLIVGIGKFDLFGVDFAATLFSPAGFGLSTAWVIDTRQLPQRFLQTTTRN